MIQFFSFLFLSSDKIKIEYGSAGRGAGCLPGLRLHKPHGGRQEQVVQSFLSSQMLTMLAEWKPVNCGET